MVWHSLVFSIACCLFQDSSVCTMCLTTHAAHVTSHVPCHAGCMHVLLRSFDPNSSHTVAPMRPFCEPFSIHTSWQPCPNTQCTLESDTSTNEVFSWLRPTTEREKTVKKHSKHWLDKHVSDRALRPTGWAALLLWTCGCVAYVLIHVHITYRGQMPR